MSKNYYTLRGLSSAKPVLTKLLPQHRRRAMASRLQSMAVKALLKKMDMNYLLDNAKRQA